jgi:cation-transporting P-type ATPase 13A2
MTAYSLCQFISVMLLYDTSTTLTGFHSLYIDLFLICPLSTVFGYTDPHPGPLYKRPPFMSLLSPSPIGSLLIQTALIGLFQRLSMVVLKQQDWLITYMEQHNITGLETGLYACHENYAVFSVSMFQYVVLALAYANGWPYRKAFYTNFWLVGALVVSTGFALYAMIEPDPTIRDWLELEMLPFDFRMIILGLSAAQVSYFGLLIFTKC